MSVKQAKDNKNQRFKGIKLCKKRPKPELKLMNYYKTPVGVPKLALKRIAKIKIPLPPIDEQNIIVSKIKETITIIESNKKLIEIFEQKITDVLSEI